MTAGALQRCIDHLWLIAPQRWTLIGISVVAPVAASTITSFEGGHQIVPVLVLVIALAIGAAFAPESHTALVAEAIVVWQWLASTDDPATPWVVPMALCLFAFHTTIALMAVTPIGARVDRSILIRWLGRSVYVVVATVAMWSIVYVVSDQDLGGNAVVTFAGFVTLSVLVVLVRALRDPTRSTQPPSSAAGDL